MKMLRSSSRRLSIVLLTALSLAAPTGRLRGDTGVCNGVTTTLPFTDITGNGFFCQIAQAYFTGLTNGTSPTTYGPDVTVTRGQMAAFITRTGDQALRRGARRPALKQWSTPRLIDGGAGFNQITGTGTQPFGIASDGVDIWVANHGSNTVSRVRASDGKLLETWTGATHPNAVLAVNGSIFVTGGVGSDASGFLYRINGRDPAGAVTLMSGTLGKCPGSMATDGFYIWTANSCSSSISRVQVTNIPPITTTFTTGFTNVVAVGYDGSNLFVTSTAGGGSLLKLNGNGDGTILTTISLGAASPQDAVFDGENLWIPDDVSNSVGVVRVRDTSGEPLAAPFVLSRLTGNGLNGPSAAAFDGQRILVTNPSGSSVSLFRATDLRPIGSVATGLATDFPIAACSDGVNFWLALTGSGGVARF